MKEKRRKKNKKKIQNEINPVPNSFELPKREIPLKNFFVNTSGQLASHCLLDLKNDNLFDDSTEPTEEIIEENESHGLMESEKTRKAFFESGKPKIPFLEKRNAISNHPLFRSELQRQDSEELLMDADLKTYHFRPSSKGEDYFVLTIVLDQNQTSLTTKYCVNNLGHAIVHCIFDLKNDNFFEYYANPIEEIIRRIESEENFNNFVGNFRQIKF